MRPGPARFGLAPGGRAREAPARSRPGAAGAREAQPEHRQDEQGEERGEEERTAEAVGDGGLDRQLELALEGPELLDLGSARAAADVRERRVEVGQAALRGAGVDLDELVPELTLEGIGDRRR